MLREVARLVHLYGVVDGNDVETIEDESESVVVYTIS
jgi:hypothetical protein